MKRRGLFQSLVAIFVATSLEVFGELPTFTRKDLVMQQKSSVDVADGIAGFTIANHKHGFEWRLAPPNLNEDDDSFPSFQTPSDACKHWGFPEEGWIEIDGNKYIGYNDTLYIKGHKVYLDHSLDNGRF